MKQTGLQLASMDEENPITQQQEDDNNIPVASRANLPCLDLLTGNRENYIKIGLPLYKASVKGDWKAAKVILDQKPELVGYGITENGDTPLHVVASAKQTRQVQEFVQNLVDLMKNDDLVLVNKNKDNALYLACVAGNIKIVKVLVEKNRALLINAGIQGKMMPLQAAALHGNREVVEYLYKYSKDLAVDDGWTHENRSSLLLKCVETDMFDIALRIAEKYPKLGSSGNVLGALARKPQAFVERSLNMIDIPINLAWSITKNKNRHSEIDTEALQLLRIIWQDISKKPKKEIDDILRGPPDLKQDNKLVSGNVDHALQPQKHISEQITKMQAATTLNDQSVPAFGNADETYSSRILFVAAEMGNTMFIVELIRQYPDLIWQVNDNNQSIFHIAIKNRHEDIYNLLYEIGGMKDLITHLRDEQDNNMLHIVAKSVNQERLKNWPGLFKMQRELLWFEEIKRMVPPSYREQKNKDGLTPRELFTKEHQHLHAQAEKWMKTTANQSMVVAVLVATIVFAAGFTLPGGYDQKTGIPVFQTRGTFLVFVVSNAISLMSSSTSIFVMFLTIIRSPYTESDFRKWLPKVVMGGLINLNISLSTMTLTFSLSIFLLFDKEALLWLPIIIGAYGALVIILYTRLQYDLVVDIIRATYGSRYLFNPKKQFLYYENPKF